MKVYPSDLRCVDLQTSCHRRNPRDRDVTHVLMPSPGLRSLSGRCHQCDLCCSRGSSSTQLGIPVKMITLASAGKKWPFQRWGGWMKWWEIHGDICGNLTFKNDLRKIQTWEKKVGYSANWVINMIDTTFDQQNPPSLGTKKQHHHCISLINGFTCLLGCPWYLGTRL